MEARAGAWRVIDIDAVPSVPHARRGQRTTSWTRKTSRRQNGKGSNQALSQAGGEASRLVEYDWFRLDSPLFLNNTYTIY